MKEIMKWLASGEPTLYVQGHGNNNFSHDYTYFFVRLERDEVLDILFSQRIYFGKKLVVSLQLSDLKYAGIYSKKDGKIYDAQEKLIESVSNPDELRSLSSGMLLKQMQEKVREKVEEKIGNDRRNLQITELSSARFINQLENARDFNAEAVARLRYLEETSQPIEFRCNYTANYWKGELSEDDTMLAYIRNPAAFVEKEAEAYIRENQEEMLLSFLFGDLLQKKYDAILADAENPIHTVKKIVTAMRKIPLAKTVTMTVQKDGELFSFKANADRLREDCPGLYGLDSVKSEDLPSFRDAFGYFGHYSPRDVVRITYSRKIVYERDGSASA